MSDAKIRNAAVDYDRANLDLARRVMGYPEDEHVRHLADWARRVVARLDPDQVPVRPAD